MHITKQQTFPQSYAIPLINIACLPFNIDVYVMTSLFTS